MKMLIKYKLILKKNQENVEETLEELGNEIHKNLKNKNE